MIVKNKERKELIENYTKKICNKYTVKILPNNIMKKGKRRQK